MGEMRNALKFLSETVREEAISEIGADDWILLKQKRKEMHRIHVAQDTVQ
jgi:hypothetical protein